jgi:diguanylate cyclase
MVKRTMEASGIQANLLELEITENITMKGVDKVREKLAELSSMGVAVSIDDFGTGYSSLSYLQTFPLCSLKIDRSFVRGLHNDQAKADIVSAVIAVAHSLSLEVVAEGVETEEELSVLKGKKCDIAQGYLLSFPLPAEDLVINKSRH